MPPSKHCWRKGDFAKLWQDTSQFKVYNHSELFTPTITRKAFSARLVSPLVVLQLFGKFLAGALEDPSLFHTLATQSRCDAAPSLLECTTAVHRFGSGRQKKRKQEEVKLMDLSQCQWTVAWKWQCLSTSGSSRGDPVHDSHGCIVIAR